MRHHLASSWMIQAATAEVTAPKAIPSGSSTMTLTTRMKGPAMARTIPWTIMGSTLAVAVTWKPARWPYG